MAPLTTASTSGIGDSQPHDSSPPIFDGAADTVVASAGAATAGAPLSPPVGFAFGAGAVVAAAARGAVLFPRVAPSSAHNSRRPRRDNEKDF